MATRAEMEAELKVLRAKMAELETSEPEAEAAPPGLDEAPPHDDPVLEMEDQPEALEEDEAKSELERVLIAQGVPVDEIEALADQLWEELESLPQNKPLVTAIGAFALGFLLGRMTK